MILSYNILIERHVDAYQNATYVSYAISSYLKNKNKKQNKTKIGFFLKKKKEKKKKSVLNL
jgi:hypothetical protein